MEEMRIDLETSFLETDLFQFSEFYPVWHHEQKDFINNYLMKFVERLTKAWEKNDFPLR